MQGDWGETPLRAACNGGHTATAALLINKGADVNNRTKVLINLYSINYWYALFMSIISTCSAGYMHSMEQALRGE